MRYQSIDSLHAHLHPLSVGTRDYDALLHLIGSSRFALLGEASHGTQEFYRERIRITQRLITEKGFTAVAVEADWPDAWRVNRYVRGLSDDSDAATALSGVDVAQHRSAGLRRVAARLQRRSRAPEASGFLRHRSLQPVHVYTGRADLPGPDRSRGRPPRAGALCLLRDHAKEDSQAYGYGASFGLSATCEDGSEAVLVGFSTHRGWVTAATEWDDPPQRKRVREGLAGSWEDVFHQTGVDRFVLPLKENTSLRSLASGRGLQRAIGVIYRPETERQSHYFHTRLADQFDAMIHIDETGALEPLDRGRVWAGMEPPETYPSGV